MKLSLVIPASNEENRIGKTLRKIRNFKGVDEVIAVSNSTDNTAEVVRDFKKKDRRIRLLEFDKPIGKGKAVVEGLKKARFDVVLYDADSSIPLEEISRIKEKLEQGYDLVIGSRNLPESKTKRSLAREINSRFFNSLVRLALKIPYHDTQCGFKGLSRKASKTIAKETSYKGWTWDLDAIMIAKKKKMKIIEIPIKWKHEETDNWKGIKKAQLIVMLADLMKMRKNLIKTT